MGEISCANIGLFASAHNKCRVAFAEVALVAGCAVHFARPFKVQIQDVLK